MSQLQHDALVLASLDAIEKIVGARKVEMKACAIEDMADAGAATVHAVLPGGERVGSLSFVAPAAKPSTVNSVVLMEWLEANNPDAIETVEVPAHTDRRIRPEFFDGLSVSGIHVVTEAGEVVPGMVATTPHAYVAIKGTKVEAIVKAFRSGALSANELLALPDAS